MVGRRRGHGAPAEKSLGPRRFALQALYAGATVRGVLSATPRTTTKTWDQLLEQVAELVLDGDRSAFDLQHPEQDECLLGKRHKRVHHIEVEGKHWLHGCSFLQKNGYWYLQWPAHKAGWWAARRKEHHDGLEGEEASHLDILIHQASCTRQTGVHHLLKWYKSGAPPPSEVEENDSGGQALVHWHHALHWQCDRPLCLNTHHLSWGNQSDNAYHADKQRSKGWLLGKDLQEVSPVQEHRPEGYETLLERLQDFRPFRTVKQAQQVMGKKGKSRLAA